MIQKLEAGLGIPAEVLIQPYELLDSKSKPDRGSEPGFEYRRESRPPRLSSQHIIAKE